MNSQKTPIISSVGETSLGRIVRVSPQGKQYTSLQNSLSSI